MFANRKEAGERLSLVLEKFKPEMPIILAVPRGGIVVAYDTIKKYGFDWDLIIPRKIGLPNNKEIAIGAVSLDGTYIINERYAAMLNVSQQYIESEILNQTKEIKRRLKKYKGNADFPKVKDKTVIIIDDGIATGFTIQAAIYAIKKHEAKRIILAIPVAPQDTVFQLEKLIDEVICLYIPDEFHAVSLHYKSFEQTTDDEVISIVQELENGV
ncbi:phosphoribosyltransferase [Clostridium oryzae]|uniref:Putative phosphoribosyl transferasec n=1 Tax=Clostridium oryzae TaxID=1450648 RepID=A0A1V4I507_9CLOT|nr:phosphoribosyltransferase family protein [Clostridium oryzae]OPJ54950.1 putative phosphoribosyl transferasec [Clostridium oryzae]